MDNDSVEPAGAALPPANPGRRNPTPRAALISGLVALGVLVAVLGLSPASPFAPKPGAPTATATPVGVAPTQTPAPNTPTAVPTIIYVGGDIQGPHVTGITAGVGMASYDLAGRVPVAVSFSTAMKQEGAQTAFALKGSGGNIDGLFQWAASNTLIFTPGVALAPSSSYTVTVSTDATTSSGEKIAQPALASFNTAPAPAILRTLPAAAASEVPTDTVITLQFNRPLIPLTNLDSQPDLSKWVAISPAVAGRFVWLGTATLGFRAQDGFRPSTTYTVKVQDGLPDANGVAMQQGTSWTFTTVRPAVLGVAPNNGAQNVALDEPIVVQFNQPMEHSSVEAALRLKAGGENVTAAAQRGSFAWNAASNVVTFTNKSLLPFNTYVMASFNGPVRPAQGEAITLSGEAATWQFTTVEQTHVEYSQPDRNNENAPGKLIALGFNNALAPNQDVGAYLLIDPVPEGYNNKLISGPSGDQFYSNYQFYTDSIKLKPNTTYNFTLKEGLKDRYGAPVAGDKWSAKIGPQPPALDIIGAVYQPILAGAPARVRVDATNLGEFTMRLYQLQDSDVRTLIAPQNQNYSNSNAFKVPGKQVREWKVTVQNAAEQVATLWPVIGQNDEEQSLPAGFWVVEVTAPAPAYMGDGPLRDFVVLVSGKTALTAKQDGANMLIWSVDLATGKQVANVPIRIEGWKEGVATTTSGGTTGADGVLRTKVDFGSEYRLAIFAEAADDAALVLPDWSNQLAPWNYNLNGAYGVSQYQAAIYTDRPIYRPDQTVYFRGVLRLDDDAIYSLPNGITGALMVASNDGSKNIYSGQVKIAPDGTYNGEFKLPADAATGQYSISFTAAAQTQPDYGGAQVSFQVEEYRKPEFQVGLTTDKPSVVQGDPLHAVVSTGYYFGGPLQNVGATLTLNASPYYFSWADPKSGESYSFGEMDWDYWSPRPEGPTWQQVIQARTGSDGTASVSVADQITTTDHSKVLAIEAQVQDLNNQTVATSASAVIHQGQYYIGLLTDSYVATAKEATTITVRTIAPDDKDASGGRIQPNVEVKLHYVKTEWAPIRRADGGSDWQQADKPVGDATVRTGADGRAIVKFSPPEGGSYRIEAQSTDAAGHVIKSSIRFWASESNSPYVPWRYQNPYQINLVADKDSYKAGETAKILVTSPFAHATGLLTIERGHVRRYSIVDLQGAAPTIEVPLQETDLPNVFIGLTIFGPEPKEGAVANTPADQLGRIGMRQGFVGLTLDTSGYELQVQVQPQGQVFEPGTTAPVTIRTLDKNGVGKPAALSLAVVDEAIFALSGDKSPDLMASFYSSRGLGVNTSASFTSGDYGPFPTNNGQRDLLVGRGGGDAYSVAGAPSSTEVFPMAPQDAVMNKRADQQAGPSTVRVDFRDTAYWTATVQTGADGSATVQVPLPDNLTTWRLTARGATADAQIKVGAASAVLTSTKPLLLRPVTPRFLVTGDRANPQAIIHNNTDNTLTLVATVEITGAAAYNMNVPLERPLTLKPGEEQIVTWGMEVDKGDSVGLRFWVHATAGLPAGKATLEDAVLVTIPVHPLVAPEAVATSGEVSGKAAQETVFLPYGVNPQLGELVIDVAPSLAAGTVEGLQYNKESIYEGTEQTVSRFLPLVTLNKVFKAQGAQAPLADQVQDLTQRGLQRLAALQRGDGGWGWWDDSTTSDAFLTAYAVQGLLAAQDSGYQFDNSMLERGVARLLQFLSQGDQPGLDSGSALDLSAYELYVLSLDGPARTSAVIVDAPSSLLKQQARMSLHARAWTAMALANLNRTQEAKALLDSLAASAKQTSTLAHWEEQSHNYYTMSTDTRASALVLDAMVQLDPANGLVQKGVRWIMAQRTAGHWLSTQETSIVLIALAHYMQQSKELAANYNWQVSLFGSVLGTGVANAQTLTTTTTLVAPVASMPQNVAGPLVFARDNDSGKLYYSASLRYFLPGQGIKARSEGLSIARTYTLVPPGGQQASDTPVNAVQAGDLVKVHLSIVVPETSYYLTVEDPLPAGLEAVNGSLNTTSSSEKPTYPNGTSAGDAMPIGKRGGEFGGDVYYPPFYRWGPFNRVEMRDDRTVLFADYASPGTYVFEYFARATTPGSYMNMPADARLLYFPDVFGRSDGGQFTVNTK